MVMYLRLLVLIVFCLSTLSGCLVASIGSMATMESGMYKLKVPELGERKDILKVAEQVASELGYKVYARSDNMVTFQYATSMAATMLTGVMGRHYNIMVMKGPSIPMVPVAGSDKQSQEVREKMERMQKELTIQVMAMGDYGKGGVEQAEKLANEFKAKLLQKVK
ncbi:MAG: hypothetical protein PHX53_17390 [Syntrophales bacterium]|nr:hypothetical protein [Syntrophales bacterium]